MVSIVNTTHTGHLSALATSYILLCQLTLKLPTPLRGPGRDQVACVATTGQCDK